jgi:hypothetical protein
MSEAEFDRVVDAVRMAIAPSDFVEPPQAANDNDGTWPLSPFPEDGLPANSSPAPIAEHHADILGLLLVGWLNPSGFHRSSSKNRPG